MVSSEFFWQTLSDVKVRKHEICLPNLDQFMTKMNRFSQYGDLIDFNILVAIIREFLTNPYLKSLGYRKQRLTDLQEDGLNNSQKTSKMDNNNFMTETSIATKDYGVRQDRRIFEEEKKQVK